MVIGISVDRRGNEEPKWYILGIGFAIAVGVFWKDWTFFGTWDLISSWVFWKPMFTYLVIGLIYSVLEFVLDVRRSAREYAILWQEALTEKLRFPSQVYTLKEVLDPVKQSLLSSNELECIKERILRFISKNSYHDKIVQLEDDNGLPQPKINKVQLAEHLAVWIFFWPFYLVSLIIGDLLTEVFNILSNFFVSLSGKFVRFSFRDVFKF